jgi:hypothetical protein
VAQAKHIPPLPAAQIGRAFVQLRELLSSNKDLAPQFTQLEARLDKKLAERDDAIAAILSAIRQLGPKTPRHRLHRQHRR